MPRDSCASAECASHLSTSPAAARGRGGLWNMFRVYRTYPSPLPAPAPAPPAASWNDISVTDRVSVGGAGCERSGALGALGAGTRYSPHHQQLLHHFAPPLASHKGTRLITYSLGALGAGTRYSPHHQQLLHHFAPPLASHKGTSLRDPLYSSHLILVTLSNFAEKRNIIRLSQLSVFSPNVLNALKCFAIWSARERSELASLVIGASNIALRSAPIEQQLCGVSVEPQRVAPAPAPAPPRAPLARRRARRTLYQVSTRAALRSQCRATARRPSSCTPRSRTRAPRSLPGEYTCSSAESVSSHSASPLLVHPSLADARAALSTRRVYPGVVQHALSRCTRVYPGVVQHALSRCRRVYTGVVQHALSRCRRVYPGVVQHALSRCTRVYPGVVQHALSRCTRVYPGVVQHALSRCRRVRTLYACLGESEGELSFEPNQIITNVAPSGEPGWLRGSLNGKQGLVPENYVEPLP
ncbi:Rho GTPase-activating protein 26 [Operophtera brumata]|uniref:Rho GTPase-activating protein 26 n=1 Tax=Operophtera brumata TaxID=104452 RepID=A0A0L7LIY2_OPEBR|nr:Rho GTPase-activating protein 26 [Operophtera brumata]